jgi:hypothetical protein
MSRREQPTWEIGLRQLAEQHRACADEIDNPTRAAHGEIANVCIDALAAVKGLRAALARFVRPSNGYCTACGGHWLFDTKGDPRTDGEHLRDCPALLLGHPSQDEE